LNLSKVRNPVQTGRNGCPPCPNLLVLSAGRWRVSRDPAAPPGDAGPWAQALVGRGGRVFVWDRHRLGVEAFSLFTAGRLRELLGWRSLRERGGPRWVFSFHADLLETVATIIRAPRRHRRRPAHAGEVRPMSPRRENI
jgi:hypothetical protein